MTNAEQVAHALSLLTMVEEAAKTARIALVESNNQAGIASQPRVLVAGRMALNGGAINGGGVKDPQQEAAHNARNLHGLYQKQAAKMLGAAATFQKVIAEQPDGSSEEADEGGANTTGAFGS